MRSQAGNQNTSPTEGNHTQDRAGRMLSILGASLWILGLALFIVGLNIHTPAGSWMTTIGSIAFLIGLGLVGYLWLRRRGEQQEASGKAQ